MREKLIELLLRGWSNSVITLADYLISNGVVVRDKAEWIPKKDDFLDIYHECSCCGGEFYLVEGTPDMNDYFFCPTCGADMRGEQNEN